MTTLVTLRLLPHITVLVFSQDAGIDRPFLEESQRRRVAWIAFGVSRSLLHVDISADDDSYTRYFPAANREVASHIDGLSASVVQSWHMSA